MHKVEVLADERCLIRCLLGVHSSCDPSSCICIDPYVPEVLLSDDNPSIYKLESHLVNAASVENERNGADSRGYCTLLLEALEVSLAATRKNDNVPKVLLWLPCIHRHYPKGLELSTFLKIAQSSVIQRREIILLN